MNSELIETGRVVNTHGLYGRLRVQSWADSPQQLKGIEFFYIDGTPVKVISAEVHKSNLLVSLEGVDSIEAAIKLKNKIIYVRRDDLKTEEGTFFIKDLCGLKIIDADTNDVIGTLSDVLTLPGNNVYAIKSVDGREILVPAVPEFIMETNIEDGYIKLRLIEGL